MSPTSVIADENVPLLPAGTLYLDSAIGALVLAQTGLALGRFDDGGRDWHRFLVSLYRSLTFAHDGFRTLGEVRLWNLAHLEDRIEQGLSAKPRIDVELAWEGDDLVAIWSPRGWLVGGEPVDDFTSAPVGETASGRSEREILRLSDLRPVAREAPNESATLRIDGAAAYRSQMRAIAFKAITGLQRRLRQNFQARFLHDLVPHIVEVPAANPVAPPLFVVGLDIRVQPTVRPEGDTDLTRLIDRILGLDPRSLLGLADRFEGDCVAIARVLADRAIATPTAIEVNACLEVLDAALRRGYDMPEASPDTRLLDLLGADAPSRGPATIHILPPRARIDDDPIEISS